MAGMALDLIGGMEGWRQEIQRNYEEMAERTNGLLQESLAEADYLHAATLYGEYLKAYPGRPAAYDISFYRGECFYYAHRFAEDPLQLRLHFEPHGVDDLGIAGVLLVAEPDVGTDAALEHAAVSDDFDLNLRGIFRIAAQFQRLAAIRAAALFGR